MPDLNPDEIIPADRDLRKKTIILVIAIILAVVLLGPDLKGYLTNLGQEGERRPELVYPKMIRLMAEKMKIP